MKASPCLDNECLHVQRTHDEIIIQPFLFDEHAALQSSETGQFKWFYSPNVKGYDEYTERVLLKTVNRMQQSMEQTRAIGGIKVEYQMIFMTITLCYTFLPKK